MKRSLARAAALAAAVTLAGSVTLASSASAAPFEGLNADSVAIVHVAPTPVVPQPVVAGHEGDVLLQVNVAMPATAKATKAVTAKPSAAARARR